MIIDGTFAILEKELKATPSIGEIIINSGFTGVILENNDMGMAMNIRKGSGFNDSGLIQRFMGLIGMNAFEAAYSLAADTDFITVSVRVALMNALSRPLMEADFLREKGYRVDMRQDSHTSQLITNKDTVMIVGFGGNVWPISRNAKKVYVSELYPEAFKATVLNQKGINFGPDCAEIVNARDAGAYFDRADIILLTGSSLVTGTMESILEKCVDKQVILYGATAGFYPELLFRLGVDEVSTRVVHDTELTSAFLKNCSQAVERFFPQSTLDLNIRLNPESVNAD
jgi:uncharacterized protein (DUF4213/DUF364 family)